MFGASFLTFIWIGWGVVAAQRQAESQHRAIVARADRLTRLAKYCGFASLGLLLISSAVWVYRGIVAVNGGRTP